MYCYQSSQAMDATYREENGALDQKRLKGSRCRREILHEIGKNRAEALSVCGEPFLALNNVEILDATNRPDISFYCTSTGPKPSFVVCP